MLGGPKRKGEVVLDDEKPPTIDPAIKQLIGMRKNRLRKAESELTVARNEEKDVRDLTCVAQGKWAAEIVAFRLKEFLIEHGTFGRSTTSAELARWKTSIDELRKKIPHVYEKHHADLMKWREKVNAFAEKTKDHQQAFMQVEKMTLLEQELLGQGD